MGLEWTLLPMRPGTPRFGRFGTAKIVNIAILNFCGWDILMIVRSGAAIVAEFDVVNFGPPMFPVFEAPYLRMVESENANSVNQETVSNSHSRESSHDWMRTFPDGHP